MAIRLGLCVSGDEAYEGRAEACGGFVLDAAERASGTEERHARRRI